MRPKTSLIAMSMLLCQATMAAAQSGATPPAAPRFSINEEIIIARNDLLTALLAVDPKGVRRILDQLAEAKKRPPAAGHRKQRQVTDDPGGGAAPNDAARNPGVGRVDAARNPDLHVFFQRASPEAAYDLFQILKRVGASSGAN
jgi:hypothetical protein